MSDNCRLVLSSAWCEVTKTLRCSASLLCAWLAFSIAASSPQAAIAHANTPFGNFIGSWKGSGHVVGSDGHSERISCRATYLEAENGDALSQSLVCASDSYRIDVRSYVVLEGQSVLGHWEETTRSVTGSLTGEVEHGQFEGSIAGPGFTARMSLKSTGRKQALTIMPRGGDIASVDIVMSRES